jgi:DNA-binding CsgD family transcriptional regulator/PAS domain-containing protein
VRYFLSGQVIDTPHAQAVVTIQRTRRQGHVGQREIELMQRVTPHLQRAYDVARRLRTAENASSTLERAFDWLADGVMLVTTAGEVTYANAAMQDIARRGDGLRIVKARLEFTDSKAANRYEAALGLIARLRDGSPDGIGGDFAVSRAGGAPPYIVSLRPLAQRKDRDHNAVAILFIHDPLRKNAAAMHAFRESFGLTEAEAALAEALQGGAALADYARDRRLSLNTVYTHLRRVKEKTGCTRLPELIRKLTDVQIRVRPG